MVEHLYRVTGVYINIDGKGEYRPDVKQITVLKETPKSYLVMADLASGYHSRLDKADRQYSFTPLDAWDKFIAHATAMMMTLHKKQNANSELLAYAKEQRKKVA